MNLIYLLENAFNKDFVSSTAFYLVKFLPMLPMQRGEYKNMHLKLVGFFIFKIARSVSELTVWLFSSLELGLLCISGALPPLPFVN